MVTVAYPGYDQAIFNANLDVNRKQQILDKYQITKPYFIYTGRTHIQGYVQFYNPYRMRQAALHIKQLFDTSLHPHMLVSRGTPEQNIEYCTKLDSRLPGSLPCTLGEPSKPGKRKVTLIVADAIKKGVKPIEALLGDDDELRSGAVIYANTWDRYMGKLLPDRDASIDPQVIVLYGVPRSGKSRYAHETYPNAYWHTGSKWFDGYNGEKEVIYDDFDGSSLPFKDFKRIFDRYKMNAEVKRDFAKFSATTHIITTNVYPSHWWSLAVTGEYGRDAIWGRITQVRWYHSLDEEPRVFAGETEVAAFRELHRRRELEDPKGSLKQ